MSKKKILILIVTISVLFIATVSFLIIKNKTDKMEKFEINNNENNEENRYQAMHHQLVASALAVKLAHEIDSNNQIGCMLAYHNGYPYTCHPEDILFAQQYGQLHNSIAGDVHVRGKYPGFAKRFFEENNINLKVDDNDNKILQEGTVDFVSISYYSSICVSATSDGEKTSSNGIHI